MKNMSRWIRWFNLIQCAWNYWMYPRRTSRFM